jgi:Cys-tRNA(Pro) deacylase
VDEAARALGVQPRAIVKSLLFRSQDGQTVLAIVRGDQRVDPQRLARAAGLPQLALAPAQEVAAVTGYPAGATPPVGHRTPIPVYVDPGVLEEAVVFGGGGDEQSMLEIVPTEIVQMTGAIVTPIAREP